MSSSPWPSLSLTQPGWWPSPLPPPSPPGQVALGGWDAALRLFKLDVLGSGRGVLNAGLERAAGGGSGVGSRGGLGEVDMEDAADLQVCVGPVPGGRADALTPALLV